MLVMEFLVILACLLVGTRFGGMGLGLISGIGLFVLSFGFGLQPGKPPVDVILTILAVISCASVLQTAGGLNVMMQFAAVCHDFGAADDLDVDGALWYRPCGVYDVPDYL